MDQVTAQGFELPAVGLGTYQLTGDHCTNIVRDALELGYRHLDTAEFYDNHTAVGAAIANATVPRDDIILTTKVWRTNLKHHAVLGAVQDSLDALQTDYIDLLLIHWPNDRVPIDETIGAMNQLQSEGQVRHIGVSNFSVSQVEEARTVSQTPIVTNQVKYNPFKGQPDLLKYCLEHEIILTAYSPLGKGQVVDDHRLARIGEEYGKSPAQVALRWLIQQDPVIAIPKAGTREHLRENWDVFDFRLSKSEMQTIFDIAGGLPEGLADQLGVA